MVVSLCFRGGEDDAEEEDVVVEIEDDDAVRLKEEVIPEELDKYSSLPSLSEPETINDEPFAKPLI